MPIHDWTRCGPGPFHAFHQGWITRLQDALNAGVLPADYYALQEQHDSGGRPDVLTLRREDADDGDGGGLAVETAPPRVRAVLRNDAELYARRADRVAVRRRDGDEVVAVIEIVSPGNKHSDRAVRKFVRKAAGHLRRGVHLVIADVFPPTPRDPFGIHRAVWDNVAADTFDRPADKPLTFAGYDADPDGQTAYVDPAAVGDAVPDVPLFFRPGRYVPCPLSTSYEATWVAFPAAVKGKVCRT